MGSSRPRLLRLRLATTWLLHHWRSYAPMAIVLFCGFTATFAARLWIKRDLDQEADRILVERTDDIESRIAARMSTYANALVQTLGLLAVKPDLTQGELDSYIKKIELLTRYPGVRGVGLARRVTRESLSEHVQAMRAVGYANYKVKPEPQADELFPVVLLAPLDAKKPAVIGYDMYSEPVRRAGMQAAIESGKPQLSGLVHLKADLEVPPTTGLMLYVPVFKSGIMPTTPDERLHAVQGILYAPFRTGDLFNGIFGKAPSPLDQAIDFSIYDASTAAPESLVYSRADALGRPFKGNGDRYLRHFKLVGRDWSLSLTPSTFFVRSAEGRLPEVVTIFGVMVSLLLFWMLWKNERQAMLDRRARAQAEAATARARLIGACSKLLNAPATSQADMLQVGSLIATGMADVCRVEFAVNTEATPQVIAVTSTGGRDDAETLRLAAWLESPAAAKLMHPGSGQQKEALAIWTNTAELRQAGASSLLVLPLWLGERSYGILSCLRSLEAPAFSPADRLCLEEIAHRIAVANERDLLNHSMRLAKEQAEAASMAKSMFLANISHEIRTPLGAIVGFAEMLQASAETPEEREAFTATILRNGQQLGRLIDDLLDLSKIEAGRLDIELIPTSLCDLLTDIETSLGLRAREKGVALAITVDAEVPKYVVTDPTRLRQILLNMIGNALKFTKQGGVGVHVTCDGPLEPQSGSPLQLSFVVQDSGVGIPPERRGALFQPFSQADSSTTRLYGGTGLGLVLSRCLAQALGGNVALAASKPGLGSTFVVTIETSVPADIPLPELDSAAAQAPVEGGQRPVPLAGLRLLLAEDTPDNQLLIQRLLTAKGASVEVANNGLAALELVASQPFDLILMDLQMPVLDGFSATSELRRRGVLTPIIALTAHALREEREKSLRAGCDDHLTKPVRAPQLVEAILRLVQTPPVSSAPGRRSDQRAGATAAESSYAGSPPANANGDGETRLRVVSNSGFNHTASALRFRPASEGEPCPPCASQHSRCHTLSIFWYGCCGQC